MSDQIEGFDIPTAAERVAVRAQFAGCDEYCPRCQAAALDRRIGRDIGWYVLVCERCEAALVAGRN